MVCTAMKIKSINLKIIILFGIIGIILFHHFYPCIYLKFISIPDKINSLRKKDKSEIFLLYGNLCKSCPSGFSIYNNIKDRDDIFAIVPNEFSNNDIKNLKNLFSIKGQTIRGDSEIENFLSKIAKCKKLKNFRVNYVLEIKEKSNNFLIKNVY